MTKRQKAANRNTMLIGMTATALAVAAWLAGGLERLELMTVDLRYRHANSIRQHPDIVCVGIDDTALQVVGRWPWPRDRQAPLVAILGELGARKILVDLIWSEPEPFRVEPARGPATLMDPLAIRPEDAESRYPDMALAAAIAGAGNVYLSYEYSLNDLERSDEFSAAVDAIRAGDDAKARAALAALETRRKRNPSTRAIAEVQPAIDLARMVATLESNPSLDVGTLIELSGVKDSRQVADAFERCRRVALERIFRREIAADPRAALRAGAGLVRSMLELIGGDPARPDSDLGQAVELALRFVLGEAAMRATSVLPLERLRPAALPVEAISPVNFDMGVVAKRSGHVVFEPDGDGIVRRTPLIVHHGGEAYSQIALTLACDVLGVQASDLTATSGGLRVHVPKTGKTLSLQTDRLGQTLIPWLPERDWTKQFTHIPADALWSLHQHRQSLRSNQRLIRRHLRIAMQNERLATLREAAAALEDCDRLEQDHGLAVLRRDEAAGRRLGEELAAGLARADGIEAQVREAVLAALRDMEARELSTDSPEYAAFGPAVAALQVINAARDQIERLRSDAAAIETRLRPLIQDRFCLIGYTATALADMKPIPTNRSAAGMMAHANLLNGLLTGQLVHSASAGVNAALTILLGVLATCACTFFRPRTATACVSFLVVAFIAIAGALAFHSQLFFFELTPGLAAILLVFVSTATYRFVFVDSERRQLATALSQYTSKEIARQVAENPELCQRAETREVTAMFTDLRGFTTISERIGAERTQKVLNTCLGEFVEVMLRHEAMVNKFIGDGIFAFWNPVIFPQADHALRACETAVDLLVALDDLKRRQREKGGDDVFEELLLRIGVATGNAVVGPCGSEQKFDYTCIGDSVNLAARLESANKSFGTRILIAGAAYEQVRGRFVVRSLGGVQVKGKKNAVPVYELLGRTGEVGEAERAYAESFAAGVERFQKRDWAGAREQFERCKSTRPDDLAVESYLDAIENYQENALPADWNGSIELKEK